MRIELPERKKPVYTCNFPMRWGDMDAMGHLNNAYYFRYFETARIDWLTGLGVNTSGQGDEGPLIVNAFCNFYRELSYPCEVQLRMYASDPARTTFESWVTMHRGDDPETVYAAGGATTMWVDYQQRKAKALPDWLRELVSV
jgi:acyl-CoA thioester hydrolase